MNMFDINPNTLLGGPTAYRRTSVGSGHSNDAPSGAGAPGRGPDGARRLATAPSSAERMSPDDFARFGMRAALTVFGVVAALSLTMMTAYYSVNFGLPFIAR